MQKGSKKRPAVKETPEPDSSTNDGRREPTSPPLHVSISAPSGGEPRQETSKKPLGSTEVLLKLSDACDRHAAYHSNKTSSFFPDDDAEAVPEMCRNGIQTLRLLLPKVEKACKAPGSSQEGPEASDVAHLCDFYRSILLGIYCPHAPHLFHLGIGGIDVIPRVYYLYEHATTQAVVSDLKSFVVDHGEPATPHQTSPRPVADTISRTIGNLLSFIPDDQMYQCITSDLIQLLVDLSVIIEARLLLDKTVQVEVVLFGNTIIQSQLDNSVEYILDIRDMEVALSLQAVTFTILECFLVDLRQKRLETQPDTTMETINTNKDDCLPPSNIDLVFSGILEDGEQMSSLISSIRQVILSPLIENQNDGADILSIRSKLSAIRILSRLEQDWHCDRVPSLNSIVEVSTLVARAVHIFLGSWESERKEYIDYATLLAILVRNIILMPPMVQGIASMTEVQSAVQCPNVTTFLSCLPFLGRPSESNCDLLDTIVLRTIHRSLHTVNLNKTGLTSIITYCTSRGLIRHLFSLLKDSMLSSAALDILWTFLDPENGSLIDRSTDVESISALAWQESIGITSTKEVVDVEDSCSLMDVDDETKADSKLAGSKRKRTTDSRDQAFTLRQSPLQEEVTPSKRYSKQHAAFPFHRPDRARTSRSFKFNSYSFFDESLKDFLVSAILSARRLVEASCVAQSTEIGRYTKKAYPSSDDIISIMNGTKFLLYFAKQQLTFSSDEDYDSNSTLRVLCFLLKSLQSCCTAIASSLTGGSFLSPLDELVANVIVNCGLTAHFTLHPILRLHSKSAKTLRSAIDSFSCLSTQLCISHLLSNPRKSSNDKCLRERNQLCSEVCKGVINSFASSPEKAVECNHSSADALPRCPCSFFASEYIGGLNQALTARDNNDSFRSHIAMGVFESLPLRIRCCLLSSLRPQKHDMLNYDTAKSLGGSRCYTFETLFAFVDNILTASLNEVLASHLHYALFFAPLLLLAWTSCCDSANEGSDETSENPRSDVDLEFAFRLRSLLTTFVGEKLAPIANAEHSKSYTNALVATIDRLLWLRRLLESGERQVFPLSLAVPCILHDACTVVKYFSCESGKFDVDVDLQNILDATDSGADCLLRRISFGVKNGHDETQIPADVRLLRWKSLSEACLHCPPRQLFEHLSKVRVEVMAAIPTVDSSNEGSEIKSSLMWLLVAPFSDSDDSLREFASRTIGRILLAKDCKVLFALFATDEEWRNNSQLLRYRNLDMSRRSGGLVNASATVVSRLFQEVDRLLHQNCGFSETQLSLTLGKSLAAEASNSNDFRVRDNHTSKLRSALRTLTSFCRYADFQHPSGKFIFEKAMLRIVRIWVAARGDRSTYAPFPDLPSTCSSRSMAFGELSSLSRLLPLGFLIGQKAPETLTACIFCDILILTSTETRERQYGLLDTFIRSFISQSNEGVNLRSTAPDALDFVQDKLPSIVAQFVVEKEYDLLHLMVGFREFLRRKSKYLARTKYFDGKIVGGSNVPPRRREGRIGMKTSDLKKETRNFCLEPKLIERILPLIFINSDRSGLIFFTRDVLQGMSLHDIIKNREQLILKGLVWEMGRDPELVGPAMRAIRTAAIARIQEPSSPVHDKESNRGNLQDDSSLKETSKGTEVTAASHWVTSHFMYLLVNVIQYKWKTRSPLERLHALRCLNGLLEFLLPVESSQYFPQIMATVNVAIVHGISSGRMPAQNDSTTMCLRLLAVQSLSKFVRLVIQRHWETIALNLTALVVSLIPMLECEENPAKDEHWALRESREVAVSLLEYLTEGEVGRNLAKHFTEIPFLPPCSSLGKVRKSLRLNGVNFDDLLVLSSSTQQGAHIRRDMLTSADSCSIGSKTSSATSPNSEKTGALQKRLAMVCALLDNENASVRRVALQHLTNLLRANRELFQVLIETDCRASIKMFLTITFRSTDKSSSNSGLARGVVTEMMEKLLRRCVHEADSEARTLLAVCVGEIGAISEHHLGEIRMSDSLRDDSLDSGSNSHTWRLRQPPWQSRPAKYELQLVTKQLVLALKAAPSSADQHKIAFSIQQLLVLLDASADEDQGRQANTKPAPDHVRGAKMSNWLSEKLYESGVYEVVEPFWSSEFNEKTEGFVAKKPPFFRYSSSYYMWISNFCRWMVMRSRDCAPNRWSAFFYACRTAVRTQAGLNVAEFIFPLLVLNLICFGIVQDEEAVRQEIIDALTFDPRQLEIMGQAERQKVVNSLFTAMDTLCFWAEHETEERHKSLRSMSSASRKKQRDSITDRDNDESSNSWPADTAIMRVDDLLQTIPLALQASAAANVGMHARALRLLEMAARKNVVGRIYNSTGDPNEALKEDKSVGTKALGQHIVGGIDLNLMKNVLLKLDDCETMTAVGEDNFPTDPLTQVRDTIRQKEASGSWEAALQDYERALQLKGALSGDPRMQRGALQCLLELGQFESVLNQVTGLMYRRSNDIQENHGSSVREQVLPLAVEAAWRLGRWETLSSLIESDESNTSPHQSLDSEGIFQIAVGKAMLGLQRKDPPAVSFALFKARQALMQALSSVARESYTRSYPHVVRLHCLREIEDASDVLCKEMSAGTLTLAEVAQLSSHEGWEWDGRLEIVSGHGATAVISTRLALARLAKDSVLEGSLFLNAGKKARKNGLYTIAANAFSQAEAAFANMRNSKICDFLEPVRMQVAKLKHASGESSNALKILGQSGVQTACDQMIPLLKDEKALHRLGVRYETQWSNTLSGAQSVVDEKVLIGRFTTRLLKLTQWMVEGGLKGGAEIMGRFRLVHKLSPEWEKGHFQFGKYIDSIMQSRVTAMASRSPEKRLIGVDDDILRANIIARDGTCQKFILLAMDHYAIALKLDSKHVYQALPRLLSLWFDFTSIKNEDLPSQGSKQLLAKAAELSDVLSRNQRDANACMASNIKAIPPASFYTAMPQLISRVIHDDAETALVVQTILKRVLIKFPAQAMWPLAWLKGSRNAERLRIGEDIFKDAQKSLNKGGNKMMYKLLAASTSLFNFLKELATYKGSEIRNGAISVKSWQGAIPLSDFVPPLQAALSISSLSTSSTGSKDFFPRTVPRMRSFCSRVGVMASKAKPKKLKAFAVPGTYKSSPRIDTPKGASNKNPLPGDIGEIHFLVKQEAKGDLRKDARVQDLNNVINRLMASSNGKGKFPGQRRRLRLRTFAVTCLSEDIGILEWVPSTESFRGLVCKTYNPQAYSYSVRRRGARLANFGDEGLRNGFEKSQSAFFKNGDLSRATSLFEELCLKPFPPLFYWWFVQNFHDPHAWYEARTRFTLSAAAWSGVGHVIGLGDRHSENILVDTTTGECVHVDFDCIFDKGLNLPKPEVIPFRLTPNMLDAFGPTGADGVYSGGLQTAMRTLRDNRDTLLSVLEPFLKDPVIDWNRYRRQQKHDKTSSTQERQNNEAKRSISVIDERLKGIYNLNNPNLKKYGRNDQLLSLDQDAEFTHLLPLSVEGQVHKMIAEATSRENLVQLYVGWMPWV